jgi:hypothetical protein
MEVMGGFLLIMVLIMEVGVVILSHVVRLYRAFYITVTFPEEGVAPASWRFHVPFPPSHLFWIIWAERLGHLAIGPMLFIFWP